MAEPTGTRAQKKQASMALVRDAALTLIGARAYDAISVEDIARASGVAPATIYRHFGHKSRIFAWPLADLFPLAELHILLATDDVPVALFRLAEPFDAASSEIKSARRRHLRLVLAVPELRSQFEADLSEWALGLADLLAKSPGQPDTGTRAAAGAAASALKIALDVWSETGGAEALSDLLDAACGGIESHFQY